MYRIGMIKTGKVTGIQPYGAFVALDENQQGLIHVSEIQNGYTRNIHDQLQVGDEVKVQVVDIDEYSKKISLSLRTLEEQFQPHLYRKKHYFTNKRKKIGFVAIENKLPQWISETLDYLHENK